MDIFKELISFNEKQLHKFLANNKKLFNWYPYGGRKNNYSTINNQQENSVRALVEKLTNSFDAVLMRYNNKSDDISLQQAIHLSKNPMIKLIVERENIIIRDNGEGQRPHMFPKTMLSLDANNKTSIKFVHGTFNMGGTGVLPFCGKYKYQLIASKRYNTNQLGFTIIRLAEPTDPNYKLPWYEYMTNREGKIFVTKSESDYNTTIKLYNYDKPSINKICGQLKDYLFNPTFPITITDNKMKYTIKGNKEHKYHRGLVKGLSVNIYEVPAIHPLIFTVNGQVQYYLTNTFLKQAKLPYLIDNILIEVVCDKLPANLKSNFFLPSRDRVLKSNAYNILIASLIKHCNLSLQNLNNKKKLSLLKNEVTNAFKGLMNRDLISIIKDGLITPKEEKKKSLVIRKPRQTYSIYYDKPVIIRIPKVRSININTFIVDYKKYFGVQIDKQRVLITLLKSPSIKEVTITIQAYQKFTYKLKIEPPKERKPSYPRPIEVHVAEYSKYGWDTSDISKIFASKNCVEAVAVNMDSRIIQEQIQKDTKNAFDIKKKYFFSVYFLTILIYKKLEDAYKTSEMIKSISPILPYL